MYKVLEQMEKLERVILVNKQLHKSIEYQICAMNQYLTGEILKANFYHRAPPQVVNEHIYNLMLFVMKSKEFIKQAYQDQVIIDLIEVMFLKFKGVIEYLRTFTMDITESEENK